MDTQAKRRSPNLTGFGLSRHNDAYHTPSLFEEGIVIEMTALAQPISQIVNIGSVPLRSPFRYPGGKTWLVPKIRQWLKSRPVIPSLLVEPFAGGGIVALTAAFESLADHVLLVELDPNVASVWRTIVLGDAEWLANRILDFHLTKESVWTELAAPARSERDIAFQTILRNRINRGGILAPGAGVSNYGENGKGLLSRWYPSTLRRRILEINQIRDRISFTEDDGISVMIENSNQHDMVFFIDPPYTSKMGKRAGSRLYLHSDLDHQRLFHVASQVKGDFLMTYDNAEDVRELARSHNFEVLPIPMKSTHHAEMTELLIGRDLGWARK